MNTDMSTNAILCAKIAELRKAAGLTQDALAEKLGVTFQAVSKWENALACPDISLIPRLADIFDLSIDALFGRTPKAIQVTPSDTASPTLSLPWENDGKLRAVLFLGTRLTGKKEYIAEKSKITLEYEGDALDIISDFSVSCGDVKGNVGTTSGDISCGDVEGNVGTTSGDVSCNDVKGNVGTASGDVSCSDVDGNITTGGTVHVSGNIGGHVTAATVIRD